MTDEQAIEALKLLDEHMRTGFITQDVMGGWIHQVGSVLREKFAGEDDLSARFYATTKTLDVSLDNNDAFKKMQLEATDIVRSAIFYLITQ